MSCNNSGETQKHVKSDRELADLKGNVKSVTEKKNSDKKSTKITYNKAGYKSEEVDYDTTYYYYRTIKNIPRIVCSKKGASKKTYNIKKYNNEGKVLLDGRLGEYSYINAFDYDGENIEEKHFDSDSLLVANYLYKTYNTTSLPNLKFKDLSVSHCQVSETNYRDTDGSVKNGQSVYTFYDGMDSSYKTTFTKNTEENSKVSKWDNFVLYEKSLPMEKREMTEDGQVTNWGTRYAYDQSGRILRDTYYVNFKDSIRSQDKRFNYDQNGNLVKEVSMLFDDNGRYTKDDYVISYRYEFDATGNWIKRTRYSSDGSVAEQTARTITYYVADDADINNEISEQELNSLYQQVKDLAKACEANQAKHVLWLKAREDYESNFSEEVFDTLISKDWKKFIPEYWQVESDAKTDFNKDGNVDIAIVAVQEPYRKEGYYEFLSRKIIILFKDSSNNYKQFLRTNLDEVNQNSAKISVNEQQLSINYEYVRGFKEDIFKYIDSSFYLIQTSDGGTEGGEIYSSEHNLLTGKKVEMLSKIESDADEKIERSTDKPDKLPPLEGYYQSEH
jgi:hypothetical protein